MFGWKGEENIHLSYGRLPVLKEGFCGVRFSNANLVNKEGLEYFAFSHKNSFASLKHYYFYDGKTIQEHENVKAGVEYVPLQRKSDLFLKSLGSLYPMENGHKILLDKANQPFVFVEAVEGVPCFEYLCFDGEKPVLVPTQFNYKDNEKLIYDFLGIELPETTKQKKPTSSPSVLVAQPIAMPTGENTLSGIQALLDTVLVGQDAAKKAIAPVLFDYANNQPHKNLMFVGDVATGKRALILAIADAYEWPLYRWSDFSELDDIVFAYATHCSEESRFSKESRAIFLMPSIHNWSNKFKKQAEIMMRGEQVIATKGEKSVTFDSRKFLYIFTSTLTKDNNSAKKNVEKRKAKFTELRGEDLINGFTADFLSQVVVAPFEKLTEEERLRAITGTPLSYAVQKANQLGKPIVFAEGVLEGLVKHVYYGLAQNHVEVLLREAMNNPEAYTHDGKILIRA